ncbi:MAG: hypothetical protein FGM24_09455 [Candidatus Kapabacteria bacterium]|nr:hypothetical protein [Candidatus Kapabacteria bacterium]
MVNRISFSIHETRTVGRITLLVGLMALLSSCYSFRGGSVPEHLRTVSIASVVDNSGFGDATFREFCTETLVARFRNDNSFQLVDDNGDARLTPVITRIQERVQNVQSGDVEGERRIVVAIEVEYVDAVKDRTVWKRTFENFDVYDVNDAANDRPRAVREAIRRIVDDVLLAVVSDW